ncbi:Rossmann-like and DUF2520 domain-containing protein [Pseudomonadota bacterium]
MSTRLKKIGTKIGFIGAGKCGSALAKVLSENGYSVIGIASRREESAEHLANQIPRAKSMLSAELVAMCGLVFVTVPDEAIQSIAAQHQWRKGQYVVYCSGALELKSLDIVLNFGAVRGCFHPLQSLTNNTASNPFDQISFGIEADLPLFPILEKMAHQIGGSVIDLKGINRARYHAAAVFASNYIVALHSAAARIWASAGLAADSAQNALNPLTMGAVENLKLTTLTQALTGPIARADTATIKSQLAGLASTPDLLRLYRNLGLELLNLDLGHSDITKSTLEQLLKGDINSQSL